MKYLGIDYGSKRIGLAISDDLGTLAFPKEILHSDKNALERIAEIVKEDKIEAFVVGESMNNMGKANKIEDEVVFFVRNLENKFKLPIHREKEFFTSVEARRGVGKPEKTRKLQNTEKRVDAEAAALILQRYLDRIRK